MSTLRVISRDGVLTPEREKKLLVRPSDWAEQIIKIPVAGGLVPINFEDRPFLRPIYDSKKDVLLRCGRQVEKSTTVANLALSYTAAIEFYTTLYVSPTAIQTKQFSEDKLALVMENSPLLSKIFPAKNQSVFQKRTITYGSIVLRAAFLTASRTRGITADMLLVDEFQDILPELIPVIEQVTFHAKMRRHIYSGTPLSDENIIEYYWDRFSTQNEWVVPCHRHGTPKNPSSWHWNILGPKNIGKEGLICERCGKPISQSDPDAQWVRMVDPTGRHDTISFEGFRIPQLMMPFITEERHWQEILRKQVQYDQAQFYNEVLALPHSVGDKPITRKELKRACDPQVKMSDIGVWLPKLTLRSVGIDWGSDENSRTVMTLFGYFRGSNTLRAVWSHVFTGEQADPETMLRMIIEFIRDNRIQSVGADYGGGFHPNSILLKVFGPEIVHLYQYVGRQRTGKIVWNRQLNRFVLSRSEVMSDIFTAIKQGKILLPAWAEFAHPYAADILSITQNYDSTLHYLKYTHPKTKPDDTFHSMVYGVLASMFLQERPDIIAPSPEDNSNTIDPAVWQMISEAYIDPSKDNMI